MDSDQERQYHHEARAVRQGALAFFASIADMQQHGVGHQVPGMAGAIGRHIPLVAKAIRSEIQRSTLSLLDMIGVEGCVGIGLKVAASRILKAGNPVRRPELVSAISAAIRAEAEALQWWAQHPGRAQMLEERKKAEHMSAAKAARVWRRAAERIGFALQNWSPKDGAIAAVAIVMAAVGTGFLRARNGLDQDGHRYIDISLSQDTLDSITRAQDGMAELAVLRAPMVCPPKPWGHQQMGGFLSQPCQRAFPLVAGQGDGALEDDMPAKFEALNHLQGTRLRIDRQVLHTVRRVIKEIGLHTVTGHPGPNPPLFPPDVHGVPDAARTPDQKERVDKWRLDMRDYYAELHGSSHRAARIRRCVRMAVDLADEPTLWQAWHVDLTGRFYPGNSGPSTMGADIQKGLMQFADGQPIDTPEAEAYYRRAIAGHYGVRGTMEDLEQWSRDHEPMILAIAADPLGSRQWMEAESPYQFLRHCFDYAGWLRDGPQWLSRVPIELDGKTNGLQHIACMARDPDLARLTNLTEDPTEYDLYHEAADQMRVDIMHDPESGPLARYVATLPTDRKIGKKPVMGIPYGMRAVSAMEGFRQLVMDGGIPGLPRGDRRQCAREVFPYLWAAAGKVTTAARPVMKAMRDIASALVAASGDPRLLEWRAPSGFVLRRRQTTTQARTANTKSYGLVRYFDADAEPLPPSIRKHRDQFPPDGIHLCDAEVMTRVLNVCQERGIRDVWMNHDSFGCHARYATDMARIVRQAMVWLHRDKDPYGQWLAIADLPDERGSFDLSRVLQSKHSFR